MDSREIRQRFLAFFEKRGHTIIPSSPLVPENDPSVLFNTAGMQPLVPYLMGTPHPSGKRLANSQKCVRTNDIDEVGDNTHLTFFEMLGNWSLGDYFKEDAIKWSFEFLTSKEEGLGLDPARLYVTVFEGNDDAPRDNEAFEIWKKVGVPENRIYFKGADANWWPAVKGKDTWTGPTGPCSEMFYDVTKEGLGDLSIDEYNLADDKQQVVEIWNDVFMEHEKKDGKIVARLAKKNVDTGSGFERIVMAIQGKNNVFDTDIFAQLLQKIAELSEGAVKDVRASRIVADHMRTSVMMIADGVRPSSTDQGYILRRLIRRAVRYADLLGMGHGILSELVPVVAEKYKGVYKNVAAQEGLIVKEIWEEEDKFRKTLERGLKEIEKLSQKYEGNMNTFLLGADVLFDLYQTHGFPVEMSIEEVNQIRMSNEGVAMSESEKEHLIGLFNQELKKHQDLSRAGAEQKFKGGLADSSEKTTALHTATHLMLAGLRKYLGNDVHQAGSNITEERLRFDFTYPQKVERDVLDKVEAYVNEAIAKKCFVLKEQMKKEEAKAKGVEGSFWEKYPEEVIVYTVKGDGDFVYSQELCGGPHVEQTGSMGKFKIVKEEASSAGIRRIKAILE